ncbi:MAG TPA: TfoX/Sxy family protein [Devosia sp.]|nr:TfoX/Sxy family protein [Devosia sp.]
MASDALAKRLRPLLMKRHGMVEKKMFGGVGFMLHGNMTVGTTAKGELLVRIDPDRQQAALARAGAFQMLMGERQMTGFIGVAADAVDDQDELKGWVDYALRYVTLMPPKS